MIKRFLKPNIFNILRVVSIALLAIILANTAIYSKSNELPIKDVLLLNSYHKGYVWTDSETEGIIGELTGKNEIISLFVEYMDWKSYPTEENLQNLYSYYRYKYKSKHIDVIITTDDAALKFALDNRKEIFSDAPIVFCGVNNYGVNEMLKEGITNVTGVIQELDVAGTIKIAKKLYPNFKKMYVVFENTESGLSAWNMAKSSASIVNPGIEIVPLCDDNYDSILKKVEQADKDSIILMTTYSAVIKGKYKTLLNPCDKICEISKVPVFNIYEYGMNHGTLGGSLISGKTHGEYAAKIALRVLNGEKAEDIPISDPKDNKYIFDYNQLKRFDIDLKSIPAQSQVINKPFSFIETYRNYVIFSVIIFLLLVFFIVTLGLNLRRLSIIRGKLQKSNDDLSKLYSELSESDEKLQRQYNELIEVQDKLKTSEDSYEFLFNKMMNRFFTIEGIYNENNEFVDMRFIAVNPAFAKYAESTSEDMVGKTWSEVFGYKNEHLSTYQQVFQSKEPMRFEFYNSYRDTYVLAMTFKISGNHLCVISDDITVLKKALDEVNKLNEELEQRVNERTKELETAIRHLESFTYTVSHDLKSPLRAVDSYTRIIMEDYAGALDKEGMGMLLSVQNTCKEMIDMIEKLLKFSLTLSSTLIKEKVDTNEIFNSLFTEIKKANTNRNIELLIETELPVIIADRVLFREAVSNILTNAVKFSRDREVPTISIGCQLIESSYLFHVKDNGVGFDNAYSQKLFGIFQRLHTNDEFEGSGIGLATVKKIIEKHGGKVYIDGKVGEGATLFFTIPCTG